MSEIEFSKSYDFARQRSTILSFKKVPKLSFFFLFVSLSLSYIFKIDLKF